MSERSNDLLETHGADFKFPVNFGHDLVFDYVDVHKKKAKLRTVVRAETPRKALLDVYSFTFSLGAVHHYAKIRFEGPELVYAATGERYCTFVSAHASGVPFGAAGCEFEIMRLVDKRDIKHDKDMAEMRSDSLYGRMRPGDYTHGHWSEQEAIDAAVKFFKEHFEPGWALEAYSWVEDERPIYATT